MARIVVLDDAETMRTALTLALSSAGHTVTAVADASAVLQKLRAGRADVLLTDIVMPGKDGIEILREVRQGFPTLPIIAMSGASHSENYLRVAEYLGAVRILSKPFTLAAAIRLIDQVAPLSPVGPSGDSPGGA